MNRPVPMFDDGGALSPEFASTRAFLLFYLRRWRWNFAGIVLTVVAAAGCAIGVQYVIKILVDIMSGPRTIGSAVIESVGALLLLVAGESLLWRCTGWLVCRATLAVGVEMRLDLFRCVSGQSMRFFADNLAGALGQRITAAAGNFGALTNTIVWRTLPPLIDFLGALVIFWLIDWRMTATLASFMLIVTTALIAFGERGRPLHREYWGRAASNTGDLVDTIGNMWTLKAFSARAREWARNDERFREEAAAQGASWMHLERTRLLHDVALWFMTAGMLCAAMALWSASKASPGDVVLVFTLTFRILHSSKDMALSLVDLLQQVGFIDETLAVVGHPRSVCDKPDAPDLDCSSGDIVFRDVSFSYGQARTAIDGLDLVIPAGQKVGIVGPSGAGKSTLIHLLQRLHDVEQGSILIDDQPIAAVTQDSLRAALAVVPQEITLLHRSVLDNIRFAKPDATPGEVIWAAKAAACHRFILDLPDGYDSIVGERGMKLSGGQRQRIGIARAFLKDAPIILLDEATSALDMHSEREIQHSLLRLMRNRTVIAVAHRLSTVAAFDRILVVKDGRIVEDGSPAELRQRGGLFGQIWQMQSEGMMAAPIVDAA